jgi:hypothetical protein
MNKSLHKFKTLCFLALSLFLSGSFVTTGLTAEKNPSVNKVSGVYHSFSETHWDNKIELKKNGEALVSYEYSERGYRETKEYDGTWSLIDNLITVEYGNLKDTFEFSENKLWEPQAKNLHGLTCKSKGKGSIVVEEDFWKGIR